jgi:hypothetical protein
MAFSEFFSGEYNSMNFIAPANTNPSQFDCGLFFLAGSKQNLYRTIVGFDVFGPASAGRPLAPTDALISAELLLDVDLIVGLSGRASTIDRITRPDWNYLECSWNNYRSAAAWSAGGGDVAAPSLAFTSPVALGAYTITGLLPFVTDAIASRNGRVLLRLKMDDEANNNINRVWAATDSLASSLRPRLRVEYETLAPTNIDDPGAPRTMRGASPASPSAPVAATNITAPATPARPEKPHGR